MENAGAAVEAAEEEEVEKLENAGVVEAADEEEVEKLKLGNEGVVGAAENGAAEPNKL